MILFRKIQLGDAHNPSDKEWIDSLLHYSDYRATEYCFTSLFIWSDIYNSEIGRLNDWLIVRSIFKGTAQYVFPAGRGDLKEALRAMIEDARENELKFLLTAIPPSQVDVIENLFPGEFEFSPHRNTYDYIYDREQLSTLSGKKYQSKRNFISKFKRLPEWEYERFDREDDTHCSRQIDECKAMTAEWCRQNGCTQSTSMHTESCATYKALTHFKVLNLHGGILRVGGKVVAYTLGEPINSDTFIIHIEKAFSDIVGAYPMINQSFILNEAMDYKYINREDDAGDEGLRTAKLSYHPVFMEEKFCAVKK